LYAASRRSWRHRSIDRWSDSAITFTVPTPSGTNGQWAVTPGTTATINVTVVDLDDCNGTGAQTTIENCTGAPNQHWTLP